MRSLHLCLALAAMAFAAAASAHNICPNPGMENSNPNWMGGAFPDRWEKNLPGVVDGTALDWIWTSDVVHRGSKAIAITNKAGTTFPYANARTTGVRWISAADGLVVDGTKAYDISIYVKKTSDLKVRIWYFWMDASKTRNVAGGTYPTYHEGATDWVKIKASDAPLKPPIGAQYLEFDVEIIPGTQETGTVYLDDAEVTAYDTRERRTSVALSYGAFIPTSSATRDQFGDSWTRLSLTTFEPTRPTHWQFITEAGAYRARSRRLDGTTTKVRLYPVTFGWERGLGQRPAAQPYVVLRAGPYYGRVEEKALAVKKETNVGLNVNAACGIIIKRRFYGEVRYDYFSRFAGHNFDGFSWSVGFRVFDIRL